MSAKPKILVTSATGKTGRHVMRMLLEKGYPVRAFVRQRDARAERLEKLGAELCVGNQYSITDMRRAMAGVRRAYQCAPTAPNLLHFNAVFTAAAAEAQLEHVVVLGQWLSAADHPSLMTREVYLGEALIRLPSAFSVTSVTPGWFADNYFMGLGMAAHLGLLAMPLGDGATKKNAPPSDEDIARVVAAALSDPDAHAGETYRPTGPKLVSPNEIAAAMGTALGRKVRYMDVSEKMMTKALQATPPSNYSEAAVSQLAIYAQEYRRGTFAVNAPTDHVEAVGGRAPQDIESIAKKIVAERRGMRRSVFASLSAAGTFVRMLLTTPLDLDAVETQRDHVRLGRPRYSQDDAEWLSTHAPQGSLKQREAAA